MGYVFREFTGNGTTPTAGFDLDASEITRVYEMYDDAEEQNHAAAPGQVAMSAIYDKVQQLLGTTLTGENPIARGAPGGSGCIQRVPPACDPAYPSLFCDHVQVTIPPGESYVRKDTDNIGLAIKSAEAGFAGWRGVLFGVRYSSRPFAVLPDVRLTIKELNYWQEDNKTSAHLYYYDEHLRNCWAQYKAMDTRLQASQSSAMLYRAAGDQKTLPGSLNRVPFSGVPEMTIDDLGLTVQVTGVPEVFIDHPDSYLRSLRGRINSHDWWRWKRAALLYVGFDVVRSYIPPRFYLEAQEEPALQGSFSNARLVDLSLQFVLTNRTAAAPVPADELPFVARNFLAEGHNLLPNVPAKVYLYASGSFANPADRKPSYFSQPFQKLLMDPRADLA